MSESRYLSAHPATRTPEPRGRIVIHNHIGPDDFIPDYPLGDNGFRAWSVPEWTPGLEVCPCEWAPWLGKHYRVR
jgi:hypothetical protein